MGQFELLRFVVGVLESMHLKYFVTGSQVSIFFGEPRFTNNIDIVVDLSPDKVDEFCRRFPEDEFYVSLGAARQAVQSRAQFNIIHPTTGLKIDVIVAKSTEFERSLFSRLVRVKPEADFEAAFSSPEDLILNKLMWYRDGASERQLRDIAGVVKMSAGLDREYIASWAKTMDVQEIWESVLRKIQTSGESDASGANRA